ncbi:MAG: hypothetical protein QOH30_2084, partial [Baekduia sp.]|nr:hypothetical protein [Baekduia sp.]
GGASAASSVRGYAVAALIVWLGALVWRTRRVGAAVA